MVDGRWRMTDDCPTPPGCAVVFCFGEIDCREGLLVAIERCRYESLQEGVEATIKLVKRLARAWIAGAAIDAAEFIGYALSAAAVMLNRIPRRVLDWRVPLTIVSGAKPDNKATGFWVTGNNTGNTAISPGKPGRPGLVIDHMAASHERNA